MKINIICNKITEVVVSLFEPDDKLMKGYCKHPSEVIEKTSLREHRIMTDPKIKQLIKRFLAIATTPYKLKSSPK